MLLFAGAVYEVLYEDEEKPHEVDELYEDFHFKNRVKFIDIW
jgi:hypothetical protein